MIKRDIPKFDTVLLHSKLEQLTTKILQQNSNRHKRVELWAKSIKDFGNFGRHFSCASSAKILAACTRVSKVMAQFVLKIEKLSHIMGPTPILEKARAYGLRPRLWLLDWMKKFPYEFFMRSILSENLSKYEIIKLSD